jgi:Concanavalin A-like lectin/glucanases superfamily
MSAIVGPNVYGVVDGLAFCLDAKNKKSYNGGNWKDLGPKALTGTHTNLTHNGNYFTFPGNGYVEMNYTQYQTLQYSVEVWAKTSYNSGHNTIIQNRGMSGGDSGLSLSFGLTGGANGPPSITGALYYGLDTSGIAKVKRSNVSYNDGNWHQFVGVFSALSGDSIINTSYFTLYVDGTLISATTDWTAGGSGTAPLTGLGNMTIGRHDSWASYFTGDISIVKVYDKKALTANEVTVNFNAMRRRFNL